MKKNLILFLLFLFVTTVVFAQVDKIAVAKDEKGAKLVVNGNDFMINGMNWDYFPVGTSFNYSLWKQPDDVIRAALDAEMSMLKNMGVNTIRQYVGVQPKWIRYMYENYGIRTILNHSFGRYGLTLDGLWVANTEYSDPRTRALLLKEVKEMAAEYKDTPGLLMYLLGNENNYGLFWEGAETENIPLEDRKSTVRAHSLYKLFNEAVVEIKKTDLSHPAAICNGDLLFLDLIAKECKDVDVLGINCYRGISFLDLFGKAKEACDKPVMLTEFGADAFNALNHAEDQQSQAVYDLANWREIYENAAGLGKAGNAIGGFTFQFSDGWWKYKQTQDLDVHNINASWVNGGYLFDFKPGENNMNEEWFGICAKGETNERGTYLLYPRAAYYVLKEAHQFNPYAKGATTGSLLDYFSKISVTDAVLRARGDNASLISEQTKKIQVGLRGEMSTFNTGGHLIATPSKKRADYTNYPNRLGADHMESFYFNVEAKPAENVKASVSVNVLGNVAENPIDEVFYENRGLSKTITSNDGTQINLSPMERVRLYRASFSWDNRWFNLNSFYRTGHYHWGYEGDFFGLYRESNYGPNVDIYNGEAPLGFEMEGKKGFSGLKVAMGPQLWWGANPAVLAKFSHTLGGFDFTGIYQEDVDKIASTVSSLALPVPQTRKATLHIKRKLGPVGVEVGGIWSGQPRVGQMFQIYENGKVYEDEIYSKDTWGGKAKFTLAVGPVNWYVQGAAMGLVAEAGPDITRTFTGWRLKDSGSGNQMNFLTGFTLSFGNLQIAPNFLWQKPIVGPVPNTAPAPGRPRNILDDPFVVRLNRETVGGELMITYDPTPATWMYEWNNEEAEDAPFAISADFVYRHLPTTMDATLGFMANRKMFVFNGAPSPHDLWEANTRIVSRLNHNFGLTANLLAGNAQANGTDERIIQRYSGDISMIYKKMKLTSFVKLNDWGPYDYHRDFNLTYPLQLMADLSVSPAKPLWFSLPSTRIGLRCTWRSLDQYSPRYNPALTLNSSGQWVPDPTVPGYGNGNEWEIRTYIHFNIGK
jgi:hypothetical protein